MAISTQENSNYGLEHIMQNYRAPLPETSIHNHQYSTLASGDLYHGQTWFANRNYQRQTKNRFQEIDEDNNTDIHIESFMIPRRPS